MALTIRKSKFTPEERIQRAREAKRRYMKKNHEEILARHNLWRKNNPDKVKMYRKNYETKNPDKAREYWRIYRRRAREKKKLLGLLNPIRPYQLKIKEPIIRLCPICNVNVSANRCGFSNNGRQRYQCSICHTRFLVATEPIYPDRIRVYNRREKPSETQNFLAQQKALILSTYKFQTSDSVYNVPCFLCPIQDKQECNPKTCSQLTQWIQNPTELKLIPIPQEEPIKQKAWFFSKGGD